MIMPVYKKVNFIDRNQETIIEVKDLPKYMNCVKVIKSHPYVSFPTKLILM